MTAIIEALQKGDLPKIIGYGLVFFFIWREVRGLKDELKHLNKTVGDSFAKGEERFTAIEQAHKKLADEFIELQSNMPAMAKQTTQGG